MWIEVVEASKSVSLLELEDAAGGLSDTDDRVNLLASLPKSDFFLRD